METQEPRPPRDRKDAPEDDGRNDEMEFEVRESTPDAAAAVEGYNPWGDE